MKLRLPISVRAVRLSLPAFLVGLLVVAAPACAQRLGDNVVPVHYAITLAPDLRAATFTGWRAHPHLRRALQRTR